MDGDRQRPAKEVSLGRELLSWKTLAAVILAAFILYAFFHGFKREDFARLGEYVHRMNPAVFALAFVSYYVGYLFLGMRYKLLLDNCGVRISLWQGTITCFMGAATNAALPTKVGDFYRAYLLHKHSNVPVGQGLGVNVGERILDLVFVFALFLTMSRMIFAHGSSVVVSEIILSSLYMFGIAALVLMLLLIRGTREVVLRIFPSKVRGFLTEFAEGIRISLLRNWLWLVVTTAGVWTMESLRLYLITVALGVSMTVPEVVFTVMAATLLASIPISFSGLGFVEGGVTDLLRLFRLDAALGLATILCDRLISFVSVVVLGFVSFLFVKGAS